MDGFLCMQSVIDTVQLPNVEKAILPLNISLFFIMFGVALGIKLNDFKRIISQPKPALLGILCQFILLPLFTFLFVIIVQPENQSIGLGMILIAACPGGNISNFMTSLAKGNVALSVTLTAFATLSAIFLTPLNFQFYGNWYAADIMQQINVSAFEMFKTVLLILAIPLILGMLFNHYLPKATAKIMKFMQYASILIFLGIVVMAFINNWNSFLKYVKYIFFLVLFHNIIALVTGFSIAKIFNLQLPDVKTLTIETGIQNSGLGLILFFNFFYAYNLGGIGLVAAWWGIWHIISGLGIAFLLQKVQHTDV